MMPMAMPSNACATRPELEIGEERLLGAVHGERGRRDRNVFRSSPLFRSSVRRRAAPARCERRFASAPLSLDVGAEHLVLMHRYPLAKRLCASDVCEAMFSPECRVAIDCHDGTQHFRLREVRPAGLVRHRVPVPMLVDLHGHPPPPFPAWIDGTPYRLNGARIKPRNALG